MKEKMKAKTRKERQIIAAETPWHVAMAPWTGVYSAFSMICGSLKLDQECRQTGNFRYRQAQYMVEVSFFFLSPAEYLCSLFCNSADIHCTRSLESVSQVFCAEEYLSNIQLQQNREMFSCWRNLTFLFCHANQNQKAQSRLATL